MRARRGDLLVRAYEAVIHLGSVSEGEEGWVPCVIAESGERWREKKSSGGVSSALYEKCQQGGREGGETYSAL